MIRRLIHHAQSHSIAYVALVASMLALAGASYAASRIPNNSVGTSQIKNGAVTERKLHNQSIDPVKWNPTYVSSFVRRWANVGTDGTYESGSSSGASKAETSQGPGVYELTWGDAFKGFCAPLATVQANPLPSGSGTGSTTTTTTTTTTTGSGPSTSAGFADASIQTNPNNATVVFVHTYDTQGNPANEPFSVAILCPRGAGGGQTFPYTLP